MTGGPSDTDAKFDLDAEIVALRASVMEGLACDNLSPSARGFLELTRAILDAFDQDTVEAES